MSGVREIFSEGITGGAPPNPERHDKRGVGAGGRQGRQGIRYQEFSGKINK